MCKTVINLLFAIYLLSISSGLPLGLKTDWTANTGLAIGKNEVSIQHPNYFQYYDTENRMLQQFRLDTPFGNSHNGVYFDYS